MFATPAFAQAAGAAAPGVGPMDQLISFAPLIFIAIVGYFMLIRPQQKRAKDQRAMIELAPLRLVHGRRVGDGQRAVQRRQWKRNEAPATSM